MKCRFIVVSALLLCAPLSFAQAIISGDGFAPGIFTLAYQGGQVNVIDGKGVMISLPNRSSGVNINLPHGSNWTGYTHLQVRLQNIGNRTQPLFLAIASTGLWDFTDVMLSPGADVTVLVPLDNSPVVGQFRLPQPVNNPNYQLYAGGSVDRPNVSWICVQAPRQDAATSILIRDMRPVNAPIPTENYVDGYGQQAQFEWPGKIHTDADLTAQLAGHPISGQYPYAADVYGGTAGTAQGGSATGYWHTANQFGKWFIIDPLGNHFFSSGVVHAANPTSAIVEGRESAFVAGALPSQTGPYADHYKDETQTGPAILTYNFYTSNLQRRLGSDWRTAMMDTTISRMRTWGFNTAAANCSYEFRYATTRSTYTSNIEVTGAYARIPDQFGGASMPDVYDPAWPVAVEASIASETMHIQDPSFNMGMFVDNELSWAKTYSAANDQYGLIGDILLAPASQPTKIAFVQWLSDRYSGNIATLNQAWQSGFASFNAILTGQTQLPATLSAAMQQDSKDFTLQFARIYFTTVRQKLTQLGYRGLYLGCRFLYFTPEVLQACAESCDVVSFNDYQLTPTIRHEALRALTVPVLISEVGFGACDLGRTPSDANMLTERDRISFIKGYYSDALAWTNLVGIHWYKWEDDVISGRYFDCNNACMGLVSITDIPYWGTVSALTQFNKLFNMGLRR